MTPRKMLSPTRFSFGAIATAATFFAATALAISLIVAAANDSYAQQASAPGAVSSVTVTRADGTVTASWDAVSGATKYHAMYSDDDRGSWHGPVDDHTNIQTTSITFSADNAKSIIVGVRAGNDHGWSAWTDSPTVGPYTPGAVSSVTVTRADGTVTASWDAVPGATKYHSMYSDDDRGSWHGPVDDHTNIQTTSITFDADNAKSIIVGVRAWNDNGWSAWTDSPTVGPYTPPPPGAVSSVTVTRADGTVTASWDAVSGATKYHSMYSDDDRGSWHGPVDDHTNIQTTSITFDADNAKNIIVGVRAGNDNGWSEWRDSPTVGPYTPPTPTPTPTPRGIIVQDTSGNPLSAISVPEGGEASYQVLLTAPPTEDVEVCIGLAVRDNDDSDITFKGQATDVVSLKLTFTSENWNTAQTVTLVAAEDDTDDVNGARDVTHDAREYYSGKVDITATEIDNDEITLPDAPAGLTATASDGSVTLSWDDPSDSSITGYEYNVNHNDTSSGNLSGWGPWTAIAGSDSATTSHTFTGLTNGREYRYHLRAVNAAGNSTAAPNEAPWFASATPLAFDPNLAVDNLFVDPGNGYLDISWNAAEGATHYDIRAREAGVNDWHAVAWKWSGTSYRYTTDKTIDYVAVRALNADSIGPWVELSRMPADDFMNVATGLTPANGGNGRGGGSSDGVSIASATTPTIPGGPMVRYIAPTLSDIKRATYRLKTRINVGYTGDNSRDITGENFVCSDTEGWAWHACGWIDVTDNNKVKYTSVPFGYNHNVSDNLSHLEIVSYRRGDESPHENGDYTLIRSRKYHIAARTVGEANGQAKSSPWTVSPLLNPIYAPLQNFTATRSAGQLAMTWTPNYWTTGYEIDCDTYDSTQTPYSPSYTRCATLTNQSDTDDEHSVTISSWTAGGTNYSIDDTEHYDIRICSTHANGRDCWLAPIIAPNITLTTSNVAATSATLTIANHADAWYYKATSGPHTTCQGPVAANTSSKNLTGLTAGTPYTYSAYSDSGCTNAKLLATAAEFTTTLTPTLTSSNITSTTARLTVANHTGNWYYKHTNTGATCDGPVSGTSKDLTGLTASTSYTYSAYSDSTCTDANKLATAAEFTTPSHSVSNLSETATGAVCAAGTVASAIGCGAPFTTGTGVGGYTLNSVTLKFGTNANNPSGFSLNLHEAASGGAPETSAVANATFSGDAPSAAGDYAYSCSGTGCDLDPNTTYYLVLTAPGSPTATVYRWIATASDNETATPSGSGWSIGNGYRTITGSTWGAEQTNATMFNLNATENPGLTASSITETTATLTISAHTDAWYYKATSGPHTTCQGPVAAGTSSQSLSGLTPGSSYTYSAYSDGGCNTLLATAAEFATTFLSVSNLSETGSNSCGFSTLANSLRCATAFTTSGESSGYSLESVTLSLSAATNGGSVGVAVHEVSNGNPSATSIVSLSAPSDTTTAGNHTFTCPGNCGLVASTTYFLVVSKTGASSSQSWNTTQSDAETKGPSNNGWSIADSMKSHSNGSWSDVANSVTGRFRVDAAQNVGLSVTAVDSGITTTATLTLWASGHSGSWWYQGGQSGAACTEVTSGTTATVTGLLHNTEYTYTAYNKSGCNSADEIAAVAFRTPPSDL